MATQKETVEFILQKLGDPSSFAVRAMFGEYALYAKGKVVALICNDQLFVKILPESEALEGMCEKTSPYLGARPHYVIEESQLSTLQSLPDILLAISESLPAKKKKA